jgi:hypothetical protein
LCDAALDLRPVLLFDRATVVNEKQKVHGFVALRRCWSRDGGGWPRLALAWILIARQCASRAHAVGWVRVGYRIVLAILARGVDFGHTLEVVLLLARQHMWAAAATGTAAIGRARAALAACNVVSRVGSWEALAVVVIHARRLRVVAR